MMAAKAMGKKNRRQFLRAAGATLTNVAAFPHLLRSMASEPQELERSSAQTRIRGIMVDAARVPESLDYYRRVIDFCSDWELNTLQFRLADDQGTALRFSSVPDLVTHPDAFTPDQLKQLVEYGKAHAVE